MRAHVKPAEIDSAQPTLGSAHSDNEFSKSRDDDEKLPSSDTKSETTSLYDIAAAGPLAPKEGAKPTLLEAFGFRRRNTVADLDAVATVESVYDGPLASHYLPPREWESFENFDPSLRWTHREEKKVVRKVDLKILSWVLVMFLSLNIIRVSLPNATADNILQDLNLTQGDYNLGNTLARLGFLCAEVPSQMVGKKLGVDIWIPAQICIFSILGACQFWMNGRASFLAFRFVIAFFQGGFIPDVILYLSYFYTKHTLPLRIAAFYTMNPLGDMVTAFLAAGLLEMRGIGGYAGWRWMFLVEGLFTLTIGIASFFLLCPSPSQTKAKWRPNGYFTDREVKIIVNRVLRDEPEKASMHNRQALTPKLLWKSFCDYDLWPMYLLAITFMLPSYPVRNYFQLSMRQLGFSRILANVLSVPHTVISIVNMLAISILSEAINSRTWVSSIQQFWYLPLFISLRVLQSPTAWEYFTIATLLLGYPYAHAIQVSWCSMNSGSVRTRTVSASLYNMMVQLSSIIGANLYQPSDAPRYFRGNTIILSIVAVNLGVLYPGIYIYYKWRNHSKETIWSKMSTAEKSQYLSTTKDEGAKRLDWRFEY
ncbi:hypothetical protein JCM11251_005434 [Rhodosporidiobolus azoricus]